MGIASLFVFRGVGLPAYCFAQHVHGDDYQENCKDPFERLGIQRMGQFCAIGRGDQRHGNDDEKGWQIDGTDCEGRTDCLLNIDHKKTGKRWH